MRIGSVVVQLSVPSGRFFLRMQVSLALLTLSVFPLVADSVDARAELEAVLKGQGMVLKERTVMRQVIGKQCGTNDRGHENCWPVKFDKPFDETYSDYLHVTSADVTKVVKIEYGKPILNSVPVKLHMKSISATNCTQTPQTINTTLSLTFAKTQTVSWSRTVTTTSSYTLTLSLNQTVPIGDSGATSGGQETGSLTFSHSVALMDGTQNQWTDTVNASEAVTRAVPIMKRVWGNLRVAEGSISVPFTARVVLDGPVDANLNNIVHASDVLKESDRTFLLQGVIQADTSSDDVVTYFESNLTSEDCAREQGFVVASLDGSAGILPLIAPTKEAAALNALSATPNTFPNTELGDSSFLIAQQHSKDDGVETAQKHDTGKLVSAVAVSSEQELPDFVAGGQHECNSEGNVRFSCQVSGTGYRDCQQATSTLRENDCCSKSKVCGPDLQTGKIKCEFGGSSTGFTTSYCLPQE